MIAFIVIMLVCKWGNFSIIPEELKMKRPRKYKFPKITRGDDYKWEAHYSSSSDDSSSDEESDDDIFFGDPDVSSEESDTEEDSESSDDTSDSDSSDSDAETVFY
uniref:Uncharacterized protein n=1 Tax=Marseillevirus LCMAC101 TaxID=2506602 RepID=A0A481YSZ7_9VIRU|nr:MAG: hypothetical protein LCMAC101_04900 [Marseillevirus LCMAC101]